MALPMSPRFLNLLPDLIAERLDELERRLTGKSTNLLAQVSDE